MKLKQAIEICKNMAIDSEIEYKHIVTDCEIEAIEIVLKGLENSIPKKKIEDILQNKFITIYEGNAEFPDDATEMKLVRYIREDVLQELLEEK